MVLCQGLLPGNEKVEPSQRTNGGGQVTIPIAIDNSRH
jgi:hypothetical protein